MRSVTDDWLRRGGDTQYCGAIAVQAHGLTLLLLYVSLVQAVRNAIWALSNLTWNSSNQERLGRQTSRVLQVIEVTDPCAVDDHDPRTWEGVPQHDRYPLHSAELLGRFRDVWEFPEDMRKQIFELALATLANLLFYHSTNRDRLLKSDNGIALLLRHAQSGLKAAGEVRSGLQCDTHRHPNGTALQLDTPCAITGYDTHCPC